jgi:hypothetical protein
MTKHSKHERRQRSNESDRVREIEAAWLGSLPKAVAETFANDVQVARARPPAPRRADMAPGTAPNPPRPGREPRPPKETGRSRGSR